MPMKRNLLRWSGLLVMLSGLPALSWAQNSKRLTVPGINNFWFVDKTVSTWWLDHIAGHRDAGVEETGYQDRDRPRGRSSKCRRTCSDGSRRDEVPGLCDQPDDARPRTHRAVSEGSQRPDQLPGFHPLGQRTPCRNGADDQESPRGWVDD